MPRLRHSPSRWQALLDLFERSSLTQAAFARHHDLEPSTFRYHLACRRRHLSRCGPPSPAPLALRAQAAPDFLTLDLPAPPPAASAPALSLELGAQLKLHFQQLPQPQVLAGLVAALAGSVAC